MRTSHDAMQPRAFARVTTFIPLLTNCYWSHHVLLVYRLVPINEENDPARFEASFHVTHHLGMIGELKTEYVN
jgi:hypothetical protein